MKLLKKITVFMIAFAAAGGTAAYLGYNSLTPSQQQKIQRYWDERSKSYAGGPGSRTMAKAQSRFSGLASERGERTFRLKSGGAVSGKINFETEEYYSVTTSRGDRMLVYKSDLG